MYNDSNKIIFLFRIKFSFSQNILSEQIKAFTFLIHQYQLMTFIYIKNIILFFKLIFIAVGIVSMAYVMCTMCPKTNNQRKHTQMYRSRNAKFCKYFLEKIAKMLYLHFMDRIEFAHDTNFVPTKYELIHFWYPCIQRRAS